MTESHRAHLLREQAAAALVASWFGANPGRLESFSVEQTHVGDRVVRTASVTLRMELTAEELAEYAATVAGGNVADAIRAAVAEGREQAESDSEEAWRRTDAFEGLS